MIAYHVFNLPEWLLAGVGTWLGLLLIYWLFLFGAGKANETHDRAVDQWESEQ